MKRKVVYILLALWIALLWVDVIFLCSQHEFVAAFGVAILALLDSILFAVDRIVYRDRK